MSLFMELFIMIVQTVAIFIVPMIILRNVNFFLTRWIGSIGTAYFLGIMVALLIFVLNKFGLNIVLNADVGEIGSHVAIAVAIPLLLFGANLMETKKLSKTVLKSFMSLIISAILVSSIVFYVYGRNLDFGAELSGMAVGLYTGGTPNLNAIGNIFGLEGTIIGVANLSDMLIGAVFYLFLLLGCKPLLNKILPVSDNEVYVKGIIEVENIEEINIREFKINKRLSRTILIAFLMAVLGAVFGLLVWIILGSVQGKMIDLLVPTLMISVTVFGIIGSFNTKIRETKGMNVVGQYFILVFSFALASSIDFNRLQGIFVDILILYGVITVGVFIVHVIISKFLKIDADCTIVTLTAGLFGPAFVPAITKQLQKDDLTAPGLITGSIGYAIGTFLGMILIYIFMI